MDLGLEGKYALVAGGGRGIGKAIALDLAREGVDVAIASRTLEQLQETAKEIEGATGRRVIPLVVDVTSREQVDRVVSEAATQLGGLHILVNSASLPGGSPSATGPIDSIDDEDLLNDFDVKYVGALRCARAAIPYLKEQGWGRIINIASIASKRGDRYIAAYTAAKHGVLGLTRVVARELLPYHITVNAICPGYVDTPMTESSIANLVARVGMTEAQARETLEKMSPKGRLMEPEEVAALAVFLAQDISKGITGQAINIDGGAVMW